MKSRFKLRLGKKSYDLLLNTAKVAGAISLIYGVVFGIFQYIESKKERRIEQSLALFRQFNNMPFTEYRKNINVVYFGSSNELKEAASDEEKLAATMASVVQKGKIETDIILVTDFFDYVAYCMAKHICDPDISYDLFYAHGRQLFFNFYQYIKAQRNSFAGNDFGVGLEALVTLERANAKK